MSRSIAVLRLPEIKTFNFRGFVALTVQTPPTTSVRKLIRFVVTTIPVPSSHYSFYYIYVCFFAQVNEAASFSAS